MKTKLDYIIRQLARTKQKKYEGYVINQIWSKLNDSDIKFVTQQHVMRPEGRALTDMYFPQLKIHIEVDEGFHQYNLAADKIREADIVNATGHEVLRVPISEIINGAMIQNSLDIIHNRINDIVSILKLRKKELKIKPWDFEGELNPQSWVHRGKISIEDDCAFLTMVDGANCFGLNYKPKAIWNGGAYHPIEKDVLIWFPKVYANPDYENIISDNEEEIIERRKNIEDHDGYLKWVLKTQRNKRIVFPRVKGSLGDILYRFKGVYELDVKNSNFLNGIIWKRISTFVKTYQHTQ